METALTAELEGERAAAARLQKEAAGGFGVCVIQRESTYRLREGTEEMANLCS